MNIQCGDTLCEVTVDHNGVTVGTRPVVVLRVGVKYIYTDTSRYHKATGQHVALTNVRIEPTQ